jgi:hypothetical protein
MQSMPLPSPPSVRLTATSTAARFTVVTVKFDLEGISGNIYNN